MTVGLSGIERFEDLSRGLGRETDSRIFHTQPDLVSLSPFSSDEQLSRAIVNCAHCIRSVPKQVQNDLLKLDAVTDYWREVLRKLIPQNHTLLI